MKLIIVALWCNLTLLRNNQSTEPNSKCPSQLRRRRIQSGYAFSIQYLSLYQISIGNDRSEQNIILDPIFFKSFLQHKCEGLNAFFGIALTYEGLSLLSDIIMNQQR